MVAFNRLVLGRRHETFSVGDVARGAGVGRSTFYEHFRDKDHVLRKSLVPILTPLADAAVQAGEPEKVRKVLDHVAQQGGRSIAMLNGPERVQIEQALSELIADRLDQRRPGMDRTLLALESARLAGATVSCIRAWLIQRKPACSSASLADWLTRTDFGPPR